MLKWFKHKAEDYFTLQEKQVIAHAIQQAELQTSGEIRVFVESKCNYVNAIVRAKEVFDKLDMHKTEAKNAVIVYVALKHKQLAIYADEGIYQKTGVQFWNNELQVMIHHFKNENVVDGITKVVEHIGEALKTHFPYQKNDVNELPNDIVFGK
jgi:uncharacterized membrane protein